MLSAAIVVADGLGLGFNRAAKAADLPDLIVRFNPEPLSLVDRRIAVLPDLAAYSTRLELDDVGVSYRGHARGDAVAEVIGSGARRGYAVVAGHDLRPRGPEVLLERAFADAWGVRLGSWFEVRGLGPERVVGFVEAPDNVGFPLAKPRLYVSRAAIEARYGAQANPRVNYAEVWLRDPRYLNEVLVQARASSFGLSNLRFATRSGVRVLLDQAAGIVIDLLVALSLIALVTAGVMLAASARAEVQRRLASLGVQRALGASGEYLALAHGLEATLIAAPAAALGAGLGVLATYGSAARLLTLLNEPAPGAALILPLLGGWLASTAIPVAGAAWPAWRATRRPVVGLLRGADVAGSSRRGGLGRRARGLGALGARLIAARRLRLMATVVTLGLSAGFVLLMLSLASALGTLETDPSALGKRFQRTASLPPADARRVRRIPGVQAAAPRFEVQGVDSFSLGDTVDVVGFPGDHTVFEDPPLVAGHRLHGQGETEIGEGLAQTLGLGPGQTLALELPSGRELRLRIAGVVSSLDADGRIAYVPARALVAADPGAPSEIAIVLAPNADQGRVTAALTALGSPPTPATGATARGAPLVAVLRAILLAVAVVDGLVCLYALIQACTLTVQERRRTVAVLRACGAGTSAVARLLTGSALALIVPAAIIGVLLERIVFGPALSNLAASYASLALVATNQQVLVTLAGLALAAGLAVAWVARQAARESVLSGLAA
jgi:ABC-type lipoprotein release transport system permease subunit